MLTINQRVRLLLDDDSGTVGGVVQMIEERPWGTDACILLQCPRQVGSITFNVDVYYLSISANSPRITLEEEICHPDPDTAIASDP